LEWVKCVLHFLDTAGDLTGVTREVLTDFLDQSPGEHIGGGTFDTNRVNDLVCVRTKDSQIWITAAHNCAVVLRSIMVFVNHDLDPWCLAGAR
jgi:hypothetical protein